MSEPAIRLDGPTLKAMREACGVSLRQLARAAHLKPSQLAHVENGKWRPSPSILAAYAALPAQADPQAETSEP